MSRFTMTLAAAATSAVAAIAAVALPAVGADSKTPRKQAKPDGDFAAFVACLRSHGLADAPADPVTLKPWLGAREGSDGTVEAALKACNATVPDKREVVKGPDMKGPDMKEFVACVRDHGLDAPTAPDAFKRWVADKEANDPGAVDSVMRACKMALAPKPSDGPAKPGSCGDDVSPADEAAKKQDAAKPGAPEPAAPKPGTDEAAEPGI
jgi:hypothetical protein